MDEWQEAVEGQEQELEAVVPQEEGGEEAAWVLTEPEAEGGGVTAEEGGVGGDTAVLDSAGEAEGSSELLTPAEEAAKEAAKAKTAATALLKLFMGVRSPCPCRVWIKGAGCRV
jgi:hypothetical protein